MQKTTLAVRLTLPLAMTAACLGASASRAAPSLDGACTQAEGEPRLTWYSSQDPASNDAVTKAFKAAYPKLGVDAFRLASGALGARYASERDAGVVNADLISLSDPNFVAAGRAKSWFVEFAKPDLPSLAPLPDKFFDRGVALTGINVLGISFNTDTVRRNPPKSWEDVLKPEYKGKIVVGDPRNVPSYLALFRILRDTYGANFLTGLASQNIVVMPSLVPGTQQLAAGEYMIVMPNALAVSDPVRRQGAPIETIIPDLTTGIEYTTMLSAGGRSPNTAKCLYGFLFTEAGQRAFNGTSSVPALPGFAGMASLPGRYQDPKVLELPAQQQSILKLLGLQ